MSQPSVLRHIHSPIMAPPKAAVAITPLKKQSLINQFLQVTPLLLYVIKRPSSSLKTSASQITSQMFCLSGEQQQVYENYCEIKGGRIGIQIDEEKDKDIAFIIGYVGDHTTDGILFFQPNLSCVLKNTDASVGKTLNLQRMVGENTCFTLQLEKKRKGFLEVGEFVIQLSLDTILKHTVPASAMPDA